MSQSVSNKLSSKKAALYIRVSTRWQVDKDSLPVQREELINYAKYALGIDRYEVFEDAGYSAKNTDRPAFQYMMSRLRTGEFSHLCVWKIDRISRNLLDFASMYAEIKKLGVVFVSKNEQFDTSNAMGEAMLKIILVFAELERKMTSERVTAVMVSRAEKGLFNGGPIPFGYDYDSETKSLVVNEAEAAVVRQIYSKYDSGESLLSIARELNRLGIHKRGAHWTTKALSYVLKSPTYIGALRYNYHAMSLDPSGGTLKKESEWITVDNTHGSIVDEELQSRVISSMASRRKGGSAPKTYFRKHVHIFAGLLQCGNCGSNMICQLGKPKTAGYTPSLYSCSLRRRYGDCNAVFTSDVYIGPFVFNYISNIIRAQNNFGKTTALDTFERKLLRGDWFSDIDHIERQGLSEMYAMLKSGVSGTTYAERMKPAANEQESLSAERETISSERRKKERALSRLRSLFLYDEDAMPEREYIVEKKKLEDEIDELDKRLEELNVDVESSFSLSDAEFISKANLFIMTNELLSSRYVNYEAMAAKIEPKVLQQFVGSLIQKIVITDAKITSIQFKNGIEHVFVYRQNKKADD
ncbi:MAG: recombinase family protein [Clostridia bacterium]|nr:recombinase family protein [Clostridia bacterium]